jgi:LysR family hydrogen peroxide-inducible transcriptional activator
MNLRDLQYLVAVADFQHFGQAAEHCCVSQPTLSGQIKKLEEELAVILFERTKRHVITTSIGHEIVSKARLILEQSNSLKQIAQANQDPLKGAFKIGVIPTLSPYIMPLVLSPLKIKHPQMKLILSEEMTDILLGRLDRFEIDAALLATPVDNAEFDSIELFKEPFWLLHPNDHPLSSKQLIIQSDLENTELLLLAEGHCLSDQAMDICHIDRQQAGDLADFRASSLETLLQMVNAGYGSTLLPALALQSACARQKNIEIKELTIPNAYRTISLVYRRSFPRKQAIQAFIDVIMATLPDSVHPLLNPKL